MAASQQPRRSWGSPGHLACYDVNDRDVIVHPMTGHHFVLLPNSTGIESEPRSHVDLDTPFYATTAAFFRALPSSDLFLPCERWSAAVREYLPSSGAALDEHPRDRTIEVVAARLRSLARACISEQLDGRDPRAPLRAGASCDCAVEGVLPAHDADAALTGSRARAFTDRTMATCLTGRSDDEDMGVAGADAACNVEAPAAVTPAAPAAAAVHSTLGCALLPLLLLQLAALDRLAAAPAAPAPASLATCDSPVASEPAAAAAAVGARRAVPPGLAPALALTPAERRADCAPARALLRVERLLRERWLSLPRGFRAVRVADAAAAIRSRLLSGRSLADLATGRYESDDPGDPLATGACIVVRRGVASPSSPHPSPSCPAVQASPV